MKSFLPTIKPTTWIGILGLFGLVGLVLLPQIAFANETLNGILFGIITTLTGWLLWVGGMLLDYGINTFVINFGTIFTTGGVGLAVDELWVLVRDLFNILFIFGLVYIGFKMILNSDDSQTKKTLVSLIIAALLINFSLFITKFVVDFTNILASEIVIAGFDAAELDGDVTAVRVGDTFFRLMGISSVVLSAPAPIMEDVSAPWAYIFGVGIINIVGAFAFGVGGIMLIIRFIALSVYMVLSPFMFLGFIFPGFANMSSKYWSGFLKQAFYAPVYVIMIFFAASILDNFFGTGGASQGGGMGNITQQNSNVFNPSGSVSEVASNFAGGLGPFILSAGFLIAAVQVAGKLAADGSGVMAKVTNGVNSRVRGAVRGGARFGARNTLGYGAMAAGAGVQGIANSRAYRKLNTGLGNNFVTRNIAAGMDTTLAAGSKASIAGSRTIAEQREIVRARQKQVNSQQDLTGREDAIKEYLADPTNEGVKGKARGAVAKMSDSELQNLSKKVRENEHMLDLFSDEQIKKITEIGDSSNNEIKQFKESYENVSYAKFEKVLNQSSADAQELNKTMEELGKVVSRLSGDKLTGLSYNRLNTEAIASQLSEKQLDTLRESGKLTTQQFDDLLVTRSNAIKNIIGKGRVDQQIKDEKGKVIETKSATISGDPTKIQDTIKKQREKYVKENAEAIGKLSYDAFVDASGGFTEVGKNITVDMMKAIGRAAAQGKSDMTSDERQKLAIAISGNDKLYNSRMATFLKSNKGREDFLVEKKDLKSNTDSWSDPVV